MLIKDHKLVCCSFIVGLGRLFLEVYAHQHTYIENLYIDQTPGNGVSLL